MGTTPLVSFCFTTFKRGPILKETLESVRMQTFSDYEVIVSDNDPEASGKPFVESMNDPRFHYQCNGTNLGMIPSFNKSLDRARGEYVVLIADDDPVYPHLLQTLIDLKNKYPGYGMYMGGCDWFCADKDVAKLYNLKVGTNSCLSNQHHLDEVQIFPTAEFIKGLFTFRIFSHFLWSTAIVKRDILVKMGGIPDYGTPFLGDYVYMSICCTGNGCVMINNALGRQTIHRENFGRNQNEQLSIVAERFPVFLREKLSYLQEWKELESIILRFLGLWLTGHMAFLHHYYQQNKLDDRGLEEAEKKVLQYSFVRQFSFKYRMKKNFPGLHDTIVKLKAMLKGKKTAKQA